MPNINNFALIVGAMKCGTTSLYNYLIQHPEIAACHTKEVGYFSNSSRFAKGFDFYQSLWNWNSQTHKYALEATPGYSRVTHPNYLNSAESIYQTQKAHQVNFKFIYILRNPVERVESHYTQGRKYLHQDSMGALSEGITSEIIDTSKYAMQIGEYERRFGAQNILLLNFEDLKHDPAKLLKQICQFLAIDSAFQFQGLEQTHNPYSEKISRVFLPGYNQLRKTALVKDFIDFMPKNLKQKLQFFRQFFAKEVKYEYVKLSAEQKEFVVRELSSDLQELRDKYNVDISRWGLQV
ncbi:MAG: sulfotransferase domain-containing protein [Bacteroidota bacterium]